MIIIIILPVIIIGSGGPGSGSGSFSTRARFSKPNFEIGSLKGKCLINFIPTMFHHHGPGLITNWPKYNFSPTLFNLGRILTLPNSSPANSDLALFCHAHPIPTGQTSVIHTQFRPDLILSFSPNSHLTEQRPYSC